MATVTLTTRSLKNGKTHVIHYTDPETGKKLYHKSVRDYDDAQAEVARIRSLIDSGRLPSKDTTPRQHQLPTFQQAADYCLAEWERKHSEGKLSKDSHNGYKSLLTPVTNEWGKTLLPDIDVDTIRDYRIQIVNRKKADLKSKGFVDAKNCNVLANRRLFVIKQVFAMAKKKGLIKEDIAAGIPYLSEKGSERTVAQKPVEIDALIEAASQRRCKHYMPLAILLAVEHGCSTQEVLSLKWSDIHLDENRITFHRTKNNHTRTHQIMPRTRQALEARLEHVNRYREKRNVVATGDHVIGHMNGQPFKSLKTAWKGLCETQSIEGLHFHDHRHTYCTNMLLSGSTLKETNVMIGHKTLRMTDRYTHLEGVIDSHPQDRLAKRYALASNDD